MTHAQRLSALKEFNTKARRTPRQSSSAEAKDSRIRETVTIEEDLQAGLPEFESLRSDRDSHSDCASFPHSSARLGPRGIEQVVPGSSFFRLEVTL
jgi:hypothetical protein